MKLELELQRVSSADGIPTDADFSRWARAALAGRRERAELVIRVVDEEEITVLNRDYRDQDRSTNVLSFPFEAPPPVESDLIGDLVICAPVVAREALDQGKAAWVHWAHMVVHGVLHLLGYDHVRFEDKAVMWKRQGEILSRLGLTHVQPA